MEAFRLREFVENSRHPKTPARVLGRVCSAAPDTVSGESGESAESGDEFLTYDSVRDILTKLALGPPLGAQGGPRPCKLGPEPQSTQNYPKLSQNGSRKKILRHSDRAFAQNFGADPARGVPPPQSQLF